MSLQSIFLLLLVFVGTAIAAKTLTRCDDYCGHAPEPFTKRFDNRYGNTGCGVFKGGIQNLKGFWLKIKCSQMKSLNFVNWCIEEVLSGKI